ncbi:MAG TPA: hypothetical protein VGL40_04965 [Bacillota bacterium]|jgi:hypothetical protein
MRETLKKAVEGLVKTARSLLVAVLLILLAAGTSYAVSTWLMVQERLDRQQEIERLRAEVVARFAQFETARSASGAPAAPGAVGGPGAGTDEGGIGAPAAFETFRAATDQRLKALEETINRGLGRQSEEGQQLRLSLEVKTLLLKAKAEVLQVQLDLVEENRGDARAGLALAGSTIDQCLRVAPVALRTDLDEIAQMIATSRADLLTGAPTAVDRISLLWHRLGMLVGDFANP